MSLLAPRNSTFSYFSDDTDSNSIKIFNANAALIPIEITAAKENALFLGWSKEQGSSEYVTEIVNYVCANVNKIDELIVSSLTNYRLSRLSYVDRAIIRMAAAELLNGLHKSIVINEALEIVKLYSDEGAGKSVAFVNKVLDTIANKI